MLKRTYNLIAIIAILFIVLTVGGCSKGIIVDTTGLTPEQITLVEWKVKYAVALDWYDWQLKSYKAQLDAMPLADAQAVYKELKPFWDTIDTSLKTFKIFAYAQDPDPLEREKAYQNYLAAKAQILTMIYKAFLD